jgi:hypothetical protein
MQSAHGGDGQALQGAMQFSAFAQTEGFDATGSRSISALPRY